MKKMKWGKYKMSHKTNRKLKHLAIKSGMNLQEIASILIKRALSGVK